MSKHNEYENIYSELDEPDNNSHDLNFSDLDPDGQLTKQLDAVRKKDRVKMLIAGFAAGLMLTIGVGYYVADAGANSDTSGYQTYAEAGYGTSATGSFGSSNQYAVAGSTSAVPGGGCCGGGAAGGGGGGCGSGGASLDSTSLADLEKQALAEYTKETGAKDVTAKASDFGCHIQMDISDKTGKIVRSYGYQGGALYVIK